MVDDDDPLSGASYSHWSISPGFPHNGIIDNRTGSTELQHLIHESTRHILSYRRLSVLYGTIPERRCCIFRHRLILEVWTFRFFGRREQEEDIRGGLKRRKELLSGLRSGTIDINETFGSVSLVSGHLPSWQAGFFPENRC